MSDDKILAPMPEIQKFDQTEHIRKALAGFIHHHPFFAQLMADLGDLVITRSIPTAATNGFTIYLNDEWAAQRTHKELVFVLAHEVLHVVMQHCPRFKAYQDRGYIREDMKMDGRLSNISADAIINATLMDDNVGVMPDEGVRIKEITAEHSFEDAYAILYKKQEEDGGGGGEGDEGSGGFDDHLTPSTIPGQTPKSAAAVERAVVMAEGAAKAMGKLPGGAKRLVDNLLRPQLNPWELLHQYLNRVVAGRGSRTWKSPNRRRFVMLNEYSPRSVGQKLDRICFMTDLSGSIGQKELTTFASEISAVLEDIPFGEALCGWFDADVRRVDEFEEAEEFHTMLTADPPPGGGGTDFRPCFEWVTNNLDDEIDVMIFITDGYGPSPDVPPDYPVIVLTTGEDLPFGDNIPIKVV